MLRGNTIDKTLVASSGCPSEKRGHQSSLYAARTVDLLEFSDPARIVYVCRWFSQASFECTQVLPASGPVEHRLMVLRAAARFFMESQSVLLSFGECALYPWQVAPDHKVSLFAVQWRYLLTTQLLQEMADLARELHTDKFKRHPRGDATAPRRRLPLDVVRWLKARIRAVFDHTSMPCPYGF